MIMLKLLSIVFRVLFFIFGIISGFMLALVVMPLPGKTFFNRMSKLPTSAKDLIDNSISLGVSIGRLVFTLSKEAKHKLSEGLNIAKSKLSQIQEKLNKAREEAKNPAKRINPEDLSSGSKEQVKI